MATSYSRGSNRHGVRHVFGHDGSLSIADEEVQLRDRILIAHLLANDRDLFQRGFHLIDGRELARDPQQKLICSDIGLAGDLILFELRITKEVKTSDIKPLRPKLKGCFNDRCCSIRPHLLEQEARSWGRAAGQDRP